MWIIACGLLCTMQVLKGMWVLLKGYFSVKLIQTHLTKITALHFA